MPRWVALHCHLLQHPPSMQDNKRESLVSMPLNKWNIHLLQNPLLHLNARSRRPRWPNLGPWADIPNSLLPGHTSLLKVLTGETQLCPPWGSPHCSQPLLHPSTTQTQSDWICDGWISAHFSSFGASLSTDNTIKNSISFVFYELKQGRNIQTILSFLMAEILFSPLKSRDESVNARWKFIVSK